MVRSSIRPAVATFVAGLLLGCNGDLTNSAAPPRDGPTAVVDPRLGSRGFPAPIAQGMQQLARAVAEGLADPQARRALHVAIRKSMFSEQKLSLHDFFSSPGGKLILENARRAAARGATGAGSRPGELAALVQQLPDLDFYILHPEHRAQWTPDQPIAVAALVDEFSPLFGYLQNGARMPIDRLSYQPTETAVVMLGPQERQLLASPGGPIDNVGCTVIAKNRANVCGGGGLGGGGSSPYTHADTIKTVGICDNGNCGEGNEFEWRSFAPGSIGYSPILRCTGVGANDTYAVLSRCGSDRVDNRVPGVGGIPYLDVQVVETDSFGGDDVFKNFQTSTDGCGDHPHLLPGGQRAFLLWEEPGIGWFGRCNPTGPFPYSWVEANFHW